MTLDNIPIGKGITGAAAEQRETIRVEDILTDPRYIASHPRHSFGSGGAADGAGPGGGVMDLGKRAHRLLHRGACPELNLLAPQIASSVENARLYEELAQREQRMEQDLKAARRVQSILLPREAPRDAMAWKSQSAGVRA